MKRLDMLLRKKSMIMAIALSSLASNAAKGDEMVVLGGYNKSHLSIASSSYFGTVPLTVEMDVRVDRNTTYNILAARAIKGSGHWEIFTTPDNGFLSLYAPDLSPNFLQSGTSISDGTFHRIGWIYDGTNTCLFVDGTEVLNQPQSGSISAANAQLMVGRLIEGGLFCDGAFKALRISNIARDLTGQTVPLVADEYTEGIWLAADLVEDTIPGGGNASLPATYTAPPDLTPGASIVLGGSDFNLFFIDDSDLFTSFPITVEMWVSLKQFNEHQVMLAHGPKSENTHWELYAELSAGNFSVYTPALDSSDLRSSSSITDENWHLIGWSCDGSITRLFVDGDEVGRQSFSGVLDSAPSSMTIGTLLDGGFPCNGQFAAVRISNIVRDLSILDLPTNLDSNTIGLWRAEDLTNGVIPNADGSDLSAVLISRQTNLVFEIMLDEMEQEEQLALPLSGFPELDAELAAPLTELVVLAVGTEDSISPRSTFSLDGDWLLASADPGSGEGAGLFMPGIDRSGWLTAQVPETVQEVLRDSGLMGDPFYGVPSNRDEETKEWWYVREFVPPASWEGEPIVLYFDGVDYTADFYLNGEKIGYHRGMYGGPDFDVTDKLNYGETNTLAVAIAPPPSPWHGHPKASVVTGWHYGHMVSMGLWRSVELQLRPQIEVRYPRIETKSLAGTLEIEAMIVSHEAASTLVDITFEIAPENFAGSVQRFHAVYLAPVGVSRIKTTLNLADPQVWWPVGHGEQPLYRLNLGVGNAADKGEKTSAVFGVRTLEMNSAPGTFPEMYRWQFVINGRELFIKGANWCFFDPFLENDPNKYEHILELTKRSGVQMLRVWGGGPIEDDVLYEVCNRKGILIWQEFPYCFEAPDIPQTEHDVMDEQAARVVRRLRNHPALVCWAGGNEVRPIQEENNALRYLGKRIRQLDTSRPYHITSPWGGDLHNWRVFHRGNTIEEYKDLSTVFLTEYGLPSSPNRSSMMRYLPESSLDHWPPVAGDLDIIMHSQQFSLGDWGKILTYAGDYGPVLSWDEYILYSQMAQADAFRFAAEWIRSTAHQGTTGYFFYKMTDIFPGQSWSIVDYYGIPKLSYYRTARFMKPVSAFATYDSFSIDPGGTFSAKLFAANDSSTPLVGATLHTTLYNALGQSIFDRVDNGIVVDPDGLVELDEISLTLPAANVEPLLLCVTLKDASDTEINESWYWFNYARLSPEVLDARAVPHWGYPADQMPWVFEAYSQLPASRLHELYPKATLTSSLRKDGELWVIRIANTGIVPAFMVTISGLPEKYGVYLSDNAFCLRPGAEKEVVLELPEGMNPPGLSVKAWNSEEIINSYISGITVSPPDFVLKWSAPENYLYSMLFTTNLIGEASVIYSNLPSSDSGNTFTGYLPAVGQGFLWLEAE